MKSVIFNPFTPIPKSDKSHVRGWSMIWAQRLNADIADKNTNILNYEKIYIDHGVNFSGTLNLFGGFSDKVYEGCNELLKARQKGIEIISLDFETIIDFDYSLQIMKRIGSNTTSKFVNERFVYDFERILYSCKTMKMSNLDLNKVIIGDSHSIAFSMPNQKIYRLDGKTLFCALEIGLVSFIESVLGKNFPRNINEITMCLGSVDIRHHALRLNLNPSEFAERYSEQVIRTEDYLEIPINVCCPVPIEHEGRKLPKTGQYKDKNFHGTREKRLDFTMRFIEYLKGYKGYFDIISPPEHWYDMDGKKYADEIMEMNSSVHIAPRNYHSILGWD